MSFKSSTNKCILEYYEENGMQKTIELCRAMLYSNDHKDDITFLTHVHGEICESVLEVMIAEFIKVNRLDEEGWFYKKGLIITDKGRAKNRYFTELDLCVFTPKKIYVFECKSYGGDKKITDICTIKKKKGGSFDVFDQNYKHADALAKQFQKFRTNRSVDAAPYQLVLFDFSTGNTEDVRSDKNKLIMPCLNEKNVLNIFDIYIDAPDIWRMDFVRKAADIIDKHSDENRGKHLEYVQSLHGKKGVR